MLVTEPLRQGASAGRWADHPRFPALHTTEIPHDWSGAQCLRFWAWSEVATGEIVTLGLSAACRHHPDPQ